MDILFLLIPIAIFLAIIIVAAFFWAIETNQFDDLEGPAHRILHDHDSLD